MMQVMNTLEAEQRAMMALQEAELKEEIRKFDKVLSVGNMLMFSLHPDEPGAGWHLLQDIITLVEYCVGNGMTHKQSEAKFHLFTLDAFQKDTRELWQTASRLIGMRQPALRASR